MANVTLLDGGIGQELVRRSGEKPTPLWSTQVMMDRPELVEGLHRDFFGAGATVATTNTYAVLRDRLDRVGLENEVARLATIALDAAETARNDAGHGLIAGAIGPLGATYRPDLCPTPEDAARLYQEPISHLKGRADLLLFETLSSVDQVEGVLLATEGHGVPVWIAVTVSDSDGTCLRSGEPLTKLQPLLSRFSPDAVLINCAPPEVIGDGLDALAGLPCPLGALGNGFTKISDAFLGDAPTVDTLERRTDLSPEVYAGFARDWVRQGATIVGGCCEVGPCHIAAVAQALQHDGHKIV